MKKVGLLLAPLALLVGAAPSASADDVARVVVESPSVYGVTRAPIPLVEVRGRIAARDWSNADVMVALDVSRSMQLPAGFDVDGDGVVGRERRVPTPRGNWTTDPGDTLARASRDVARAVIRELTERGARVGLVSFSERAYLRAHVGQTERALAAVDRLRRRRDGGSTNLAAAARLALGEFEELAELGDLREPVLVFVSDGFPTQPHEDSLAARAARRAGEQAAEQGVQVFALALGDERGVAPSFRELAECTGGSFAVVSGGVDPARAALGLAPPGELTALQIVNRTMDTPGRAVRWFADGSFDGYLPVRTGANQLEVEARMQAGATLRLTRRFQFARGPVDGFAARLSARTAETEALARSQGPRARDLEISVEE